MTRKCEAMKKGERLRGLAHACRFCPFQIELADGMQIYF